MREELHFSIENLKNTCEDCSEKATTRYWGHRKKNGFYCSEHTKDLLEGLRNDHRPTDAG